LTLSDSQYIIEATFNVKKVGVNMDPFLGQIELFPYQNRALMGWQVCSGQILNVSQYQALYSLIGFTYGGNGTTTFALPNLLGTEPVPYMKYYIAMEGLYPTRQ
jgi:microcystin-dependent protein